MRPRAPAQRAVFVNCASRWYSIHVVDIRTELRLGMGLEQIMRCGLGKEALFKIAARTLLDPTTCTDLRITGMLEGDVVRQEPLRWSAQATTHGFSLRDYPIGRVLTPADLSKGFCHLFLFYPDGR